VPAPAVSPDAAIIGVQSSQLSGAESVDSVPSISGGRMRIQLRATLHHVGADPYGLAGGEVGCDVVERHGEVV